MANEIRDIRDFAYGQLTNAAVVADTTLVSAGFVGLPGGVYSTTRYLPIVLVEPISGVREVVWVTAHTASSSSVTVVRAKEGTTALGWAAGTQWKAAPTAARDGLGVLARASLPTDPHIGLRQSLSDESGVAVERTANAGWQSSVGVANPADFGLRFGPGTVAPAGNVMLMRGGSRTQNTAGGGKVTATFTQPFPGGCAIAVGMAANALVELSSVTASTAVFQCWGAAGSPAPDGLSVTIQYLAVGY